MSKVHQITDSKIREQKVMEKHAKREKQSEQMLADYKIYLTEEEKSANTILRYLADARRFLDFLSGDRITRGNTLDFKHHLVKKYRISSVNSMMAALNHFLKFRGLKQYRVKNIRVQKKMFCNEEKELERSEYIRLIRTAEQERNWKLAMIMRTMGCTGIRISELRYLTVEAVMQGELHILCKGKYRVVLIPYGLKNKLMNYIEENKISSGTVFITKRGKPIDRSNIWRKMREIALLADVEQTKVFPHNFRHLFARTYYQAQKDIVKLADMLGHANIGTTRLYVVSTGAEHRRQLEALNLMV